MATLKMYCKDPATSSGSKIKWHEAPTMYIKGTLTFERKATNDKKIYVTGKLTNSIYSGSYYGYKITAAIFVGGTSDSHNKKEITICSASDNGSGSGSFNFNFKYTGTGNAYCYIFCNGGGTHKCSSDAGNFAKVKIGTVDLGDLPYKAETNPTNFTSGKVFNQSGVQNGNEKPDRSIKVTWSGEKPGSYSFNAYSIDLFLTSGHYNESNYRVASFNNVSKDTLYNLNNVDYNENSIYYPRKFRPGDTLYVCIRAHSTKGGGSWLPRYFVGTIKLYKDGRIIYKQNASNSYECTKLYFKDSSGSVKKGRYAIYKNGSTIKVIDMYTYCYE